MIRTQLRITSSRNVLDIYRNRRFKLEARFPGGRTILKGKEATRARAFDKALSVARPQTSPTAAGASGVSGTYFADPVQGQSISNWQFNPTLGEMTNIP